VLTGAGCRAEGAGHPQQSTGAPHTTPQHPPRAPPPPPQPTHPSTGPRTRRRSVRSCCPRCRTSPRGQSARTSRPVTSRTTPDPATSWPRRGRCPPFRMRNRSGRTPIQSQNLTAAFPGRPSSVSQFHAASQSRHLGASCSYNDVICTNHRHRTQEGKRMVGLNGPPLTPGDGAIGVAGVPSAGGGRPQRRAEGTRRVAARSRPAT